MTLGMGLGIIAVSMVLFVPELPHLICEITCYYDPLLDLAGYLSYLFPLMGVIYLTAGAGIALHGMRNTYLKSRFDMRPGRIECSVCGCRIDATGPGVCYPCFLGNGMTVGRPSPRMLWPGEEIEHLRGRHKGLEAPMEGCHICERRWRGKE